MEKLFSLLVIFIIGFCTPAIAQNSKASIDVDPEVDNLVQLKAELTKHNKLSDRYTIQIGSFSSKKTANKSLSEFKDDFPDIDARLEWESPNYKIWVGHFSSRLEAERLFNKIKTTYKSAFVFKPNPR